MNPNTHPEQLQVLGAGLAVWGLEGNSAAQPEAGAVGRAGYRSVQSMRAGIWVNPLWEILFFHPDLGVEGPWG